ncbi:hypothetical protein HYPSUDRAFT_1034045 [Hypholoma sublateritium FD-334 SS-4]|uniref:Uncharacterized protein n=1 Tax=Hypholoma sublateritium (strain FD-334 SS-4) TaxID=945553 RepID=A0A0D2MSA1_HYPSF|nr:hypothetical protein HYPSUDRAFT_1034045 [Hypholoma sublateritium FD-334 SS-4]
MPFRHLLGCRRLWPLPAAPHSLFFRSISLVLSHPASHRYSHLSYPSSFRYQIPIQSKPRVSSANNPCTCRFMFDLFLAAAACLHITGRRPVVIPPCSFSLRPVSSWYKNCLYYTV